MWCISLCWKVIDMDRPLTKSYANWQRVYLQSPFSMWTRVDLLGYTDFRCVMVSSEWQDDIAKDSTTSCNRSFWYCLLYVHASSQYGPLNKYAKLRVKHAPGMLGERFPHHRSWHASCHVRHARVMMHVRIANSRWRRKRSGNSRRMRNPQFSVYGKRPMVMRSPI